MKIKTYNPTARSPYFDIDRSSDYIISCRLSKDNQASTFEQSHTSALKCGVGLRLTFYNSSNINVTATGVDDYYEKKEWTPPMGDYSPSLNHLLIESVNIPTGISGYKYISRVVKGNLTPPSATKASLDAVGYGIIDTIVQDGSGSFYWSNPKVTLADPYFYCTGDHGATDDLSPTNLNPVGENPWSQDFIFQPSYGSSVTFSCDDELTQMGNGYYEYMAKYSNSVLATWQLRFENRSDEEAKSIIHYLENHAGKEFNWTPPYPYNKKNKFECESFSLTYSKENSNSVSASFKSRVDLLNWKDSISPYTGLWQSSEQYEQNDYIAYVDSHEVMNHDKYYYCKEKPVVGENPSSSKKWNRGHFFWNASEGQSTQFDPRIKKIKIKDAPEELEEEDVNANLLKFNQTFNLRTEKECAGITHFLSRHLGHKPFTLNSPVFLSDNQVKSTTVALTNNSLINPGHILVSGSQILNLDLTSPISIPVGLKRFYREQELICETAESTHNKLYLAEDALDGDTSIKVKTRKYTGPISNGSTFTINASVSRFYCRNWSHNFNFKDNHSINASFTEYPIEENAITHATGVKQLPQHQRALLDGSKRYKEGFPPLNVYDENSILIAAMNPLFEPILIFDVNKNIDQIYHKDVFIQNTGTSQISITNISISADGHEAFDVSSKYIPRSKQKADLNGDLFTPFTIDVGESAPINYCYLPSKTFTYAFSDPPARASRATWRILATIDGVNTNLTGLLSGNISDVQFVTDSNGAFINIGDSSASYSDYIKIE